MLVGREREVTRLERILEDARASRGRALVIRGEAGIGKSALLAAALERADGLQVASTHGVESEAELAFSALRDVCTPLLRHLDDLADQQAAALRSVLGVGPVERVDRLAAGAATLSLLSTAAAEAPLVVVVDDAHWIDAGSSDALLFAARRLQADRVAVLFAVREREGADLPADGLQEMVLNGLDPADAAIVLQQSSAAAVSQDVEKTLCGITRGNPLALVELPSVLTPAQLDGREPLDDPIRVGRRVEQAFLRRVAALDKGARDGLLLAAASTSDRCQPVWAALDAAGIDGAALVIAEDAGLVKLDGGRLQFSHPLVRSAVYQSAPASARRAANKALADAFGGDGDHERRAWHLAAAALRPDEEVAAALDEAAASARDRSGYVAAGAAYERAARLTPKRLPRLWRLFGAADTRWLAGDSERALALLDEALSDCDDPELRANLLHLRGRIEHRRGWASARQTLLEAAALIDGTDSHKAVLILADAVQSCFFGGDSAAMLETAERLRLLASPDDASEEFFANFTLGAALILNGRPAEGRPLVHRAVSLVKTSDALQSDPHYFALVGVASGWAGRPEEGRELVEWAIGKAREVGAFGVLPPTLARAAGLDYWLGRWPQAYAEASEAVELAREAGMTMTVCDCLGLLARIDAAQGNEEACLAQSDEAIQLADELRMPLLRVEAEQALGLLHLGSDRLEEAVTAFEQAERTLATHGVRDAFRCAAYDLVDAYIRTGRRPEAEATFTAFAALVDESPGAETLARAGRCRGLLGDDEHFEAEFLDALARHAEAEDRFEQARTELCFGERLRREGRRRKARLHLHEALDTFERFHARPWADRARKELRASGERLRRRDVTAPEELTPQELQVALAVAGGGTNRDVGAALFLSPKTVEWHLGRVYRKLRISSRGELIRVFAEEAAAVDRWLPSAAP